VTERTVHLTDRQARVVAHALVYNRLVGEMWPDWGECPHLDQDSRDLIGGAVEVLSKRVLESAFEMVDDPDEVDELLQRAQYGGDE